MVSLHIMVMIASLVGTISMNNSPPKAFNNIRNKKIQRKVHQGEIKRHQLQNSKDYNPVYTDKSSNQPAKLAEANDGRPIVELYARGYRAIWSRYEDVYGDESLVDLSQKIACSSGIEEEVVRSDIDKWMISAVFGVGMGGATLAMSKVKEILPFLRKVKSRDFEFGYRVLIMKEDGTVLDSNIYSLQNPSPKSSTRVWTTEHSAHQAIDVQGALDFFRSQPANAMRSLFTSRDVTDLLDDIHRFSQAFKSSDATDIFVFTDGSALVPSSRDTNKTITAASAGVCLIAMRNNEPAVLTGNDAISTSATATQSQPRRLACLCVRITRAVSVVSVPYDAELIAGLAGVGLVKAALHPKQLRLLRYGSSSSDDCSSRSFSGDRLNDSLDATLCTDSKALDVTLCTDSKTLVRVFRARAAAAAKHTGDSYDGISASKTMGDSPHDHPASSSSSSRGLLTALMCDLANSLTQSSSSSLLQHFSPLSTRPGERVGGGTGVEAECKTAGVRERDRIDNDMSIGDVCGSSSSSSSRSSLASSFSAVWVAGHPERTQSNNRAAWTLQEVGVWAADEIAGSVGKCFDVVSRGAGGVIAADMSNVTKSLHSATAVDEAGAVTTLPQSSGTETIESLAHVASPLYDRVIKNDIHTISASDLVMLCAAVLLL